MASSSAQLVTFDVADSSRVSGLLELPPNPRAVYVLAHGAGAGMKYPFMNAIAGELAALGVGTLRYQFPYMEQGSKRPDPPQLCHATVRAAVSEAARLSGNARLIAGGKSFGGRMTSQAQAAAPLPGVLGLAFLGFPLHPAKRPATDRAKHLSDVRIPMLFLQGTRDELAELTLLEPIAQQLGSLATLQKIENADHSFHVPARSGRKDADIIKDLAASLATWSDTL